MIVEDVTPPELRGPSDEEKLQAATARIAELEAQLAPQGKAPHEVDFMGRRWRVIDAVSPYTCEGCEAQKGNGVPCGVATGFPPCGDGILMRAEQEGGST